MTLGSRSTPGQRFKAWSTGTDTPGGWLLLAPFLLGALLLIGLPIALTCIQSVYINEAVSATAWVGALNFRTVFRDPLFHVAVQNSLLLMALAVPLRLLAALALALLLQDRQRGSRVYRAVVFLPSIVPDVAYALLWLWILNPLYGPLNFVLGALGVPRPDWLVEPRSALWSMVLMSLFQIGEGFVLLIAALKLAPQECNDAALIDGAGRWQTFRFITLPLMLPWLSLLALRDIVVTAQSSFMAATLMTGGGPYYATLFLPMLVHEEAFEHLRFGTASAMLVVMFGFVLALIALVAVVMRGWHAPSDD